MGGVGGGGGGVKGGGISRGGPLQGLKLRGGGLVVLGGDNVSPPLVKIGLTDLPKTGGLKPCQPPRLRRP